MLNAVLFDLDNTLVLFDETAFYGRYFGKLADFFADLLPPPQMQERVLRATRSLAGRIRPVRLSRISGSLSGSL